MLQVDGHSLTLEDVLRVVHEREHVSLSENAIPAMIAIRPPGLRRRKHSFSMAYGSLIS